MLDNFMGKMEFSNKLETDLSDISNNPNNVFTKYMYEALDNIRKNIFNPIDEPFPSDTEIKALFNNSHKRSVLRNTKLTTEVINSIFELKDKYSREAVFCIVHTMTISNAPIYNSSTFHANYKSRYIFADLLESVSVTNTIFNTDVENFTSLKNIKLLFNNVNYVELIESSYSKIIKRLKKIQDETHDLLEGIEKYLVIATAVTLCHPISAIYTNGLIESVGESFLKLANVRPSYLISEDLTNYWSIPIINLTAPCMTVTKEIYGKYLDTCKVISRIVDISIDLEVINARHLFKYCPLLCIESYFGKLRSNTNNRYLMELITGIHHNFNKYRNLNIPLEVSLPNIVPSTKFDLGTKIGNMLCTEFLEEKTSSSPGSDLLSLFNQVLNDTKDFYFPMKLKDNMLPLANVRIAFIVNYIHVDKALYGKNNSYGLVEQFYDKHTRYFVDSNEHHRYNRLSMMSNGAENNELMEIFEAYNQKELLYYTYVIKTANQFINNTFVRQTHRKLYNMEKLLINLYMRCNAIDSLLNFNLKTSAISVSDVYSLLAFQSNKEFMCNEDENFSRYLMTATKEDFKGIITTKQVVDFIDRSSSKININPNEKFILDYCLEFEEKHKDLILHPGIKNVLSSVKVTNPYYQDEPNNLTTSIVNIETVINSFNHLFLS